MPVVLNSLSVDDVPRLFAAGRGCASIAAAVGVSVRHVRRLVVAAGLRPPQTPMPPPDLFDAIIRREVKRHGGAYGYGMMRGVLSAHHPEWRFPRRRVLEALQRMFPGDAEIRKRYTAQRLERGRVFSPHDGYTWQLDYACKLQQYDIYVAAIIDTCTRKLLKLKVPRSPTLVPVLPTSPLLLPRLTPRLLLPARVRSSTTSCPSRRGSASCAPRCGRCACCPTS